MVLVCLLVCLFVFGVCPLFPCGMTPYDLTPRVSEAVTASASLAVINTASKHLHNDLARAIEALEQKKNKNLLRERCGKVKYFFFRPSPSRL